jgi:hypothetical protein
VRNVALLEALAHKSTAADGPTIVEYPSLAEKQKAGAGGE